MAPRFQGPKGTRDFYPADMALLKHILGAWHQVAARFGYTEVEGPCFEHLELFTEKSGPEIAEQLYVFEDRSGRRLALRPEFTPTLARMAGSLGRNLRRPSRWYCVPRLWRYEKQQRGRLREFLQLNLDVLGESGPGADAELIATACAICADLGLTATDVEVRLSSRRLVSALLDAMGCADKSAAYLALDRRAKLPRDAWVESLNRAGLGTDAVEKLDAFFACITPVEVLSVANTQEVGGALAELDELFRLIDFHGCAAWVRFDPSVVRGLAYYTGPVWEMFDRRGELRAVAGGGRYDDLLGRLGGEDLPASGFGMGDVVLAELLRDRNLAPAPVTGPDIWLVSVDDDMPGLVRTATALRARGLHVGHVLSPTRVGRQMQIAGESGCRRAIFVGGDCAIRGEVEVRNLTTGEQTTMPLHAV